METPIFAPLGGGRIGKAEAFDVLAEALNIKERPLGAVRHDIFRLVFDLGTYAFQEGGQGKLSSLTVWSESWDLLGCLYEGLSVLENEAMALTHKANLVAFLDNRSAEQEAQDRADALGSAA